MLRDLSYEYTDIPANPFSKFFMFEVLFETHFIEVWLHFFFTFVLFSWLFLSLPSFLLQLLADNGLFHNKAKNSGFQDIYVKFICIYCVMKLGPVSLRQLKMNKLAQRLILTALFLFYGGYSYGNPLKDQIKQTMQHH